MTGRSSLSSASVIIPTYNRRDALMETLSALAAQDFPAGRWEAMVVDDGSSDGTPEAVEEWAARSGAPVRVLRQRNAGPAAARNRGAAAATGDVLIFIDNDILVRPTFIRDHVETLSAHPGCWVIGRIVHPAQLRETPFGRYRDKLWEQFHHSHPADRVSPTEGSSAANLSLPAADFRRLGGFDEGFTIASCEDWELGMRARRDGVQVLYNPAIEVVHNDWAVNLDRYCERQRLYSISDVLLWRKYGDLSPRRELVRRYAPVSLGDDGPALVAEKVARGVLASAPSRFVVRRLCGVAERLAADSSVSRRAYDLLVSLEMFRGVREGLRRYGPGGEARAAQ